MYIDRPRLETVGILLARAALGHAFPDAAAFEGVPDLRVRSKGEEDLEASLHGSVHVRERVYAFIIHFGPWNGITPVGGESIPLRLTIGDGTVLIGRAFRRDNKYVVET